MSFDRWSLPVTPRSSAASARDADPVAELHLHSASFGGAPILGALSVSVFPGETVALQGPSGIGKTTLLRILAGLEHSFEGTRRVTSRSAFVFQEPTLLPWRSALDNLTLVTGCTSAMALQLLDDVGLTDKARAYPGQLSLGQQRRLALARALAADPELLLLDEPFVSLDPALVEEMLQLFATLTRQHGVATLLVTHAAREAEALATRILTLGGQPATCVAERPNVPRV